MALKAKIARLEDVEEALRGFYVQAGDEYVLDTEDGEFRSKINEFRGNNIELRQKVEKLEQQLGGLSGIDKDKFEAALKAQQELADLKAKGVLDNAGVKDEEFQKLLQERTEQMRGDFETQLNALKKANADLEARSDKLAAELKHDRVKSIISEAVSEFGVPRKGAMHDILARAASVWDRDDNGQPVAVAEGRKIFGKDGNNPLTPAEWVNGLARDAGYLFEPNAGGGAGGGSGNGAAPGGTVDWNDQKAISENWQGIADGTVQVTRSGE